MTVVNKWFDFEGKGAGICLMDKIRKIGVKDIVGLWAYATTR